MKSIKNIYWTTKEGKKIALSNMKTTHIENCIVMLERAVASRPNEYQWGEPNGEMAQDAFHSEVRHNDAIEESFRLQIKTFNIILTDRIKEEKYNRIERNLCEHDKNK